MHHKTLVHHVKEEWEGQVKWEFCVNEVVPRLDYQLGKVANSPGKLQPIYVLVSGLC